MNNHGNVTPPKVTNSALMASMELNQEKSQQIQKNDSKYVRRNEREHKFSKYTNRHLTERRRPVQYMKVKSRNMKYKRERTRKMKTQPAKPKATWKGWVTEWVKERQSISA